MISELKVTVSIPLTALIQESIMTSKKIVVQLGQDTPAYASFSMDADTSMENIKTEARRQASNLTFTPSWDWSGLRIVDITGSDGTCLGSDIALERSGEDLGLVAENWLHGTIPFSSLRAEAERQGILREASEEHPMRELQAEYHFKGDAAPKVVRFTAPKDASPDEIIMLAHKAIVQLTAQHRIIPAQPHNGLAFAPFKLVMEVFALDEYGDSPSTAMIEVSHEFVRHLQQLSALCRNNNLSVVQKHAHLQWDDERLNMRGDLLTVSSDGCFWYSAHPKHQDYNCETRSINIDSLLAAIARRDDAAQGGQCFRWIDGVLFYAADHGYVQDMAENWLDANPGDWVIFHPGEHTCSDDRAGFWCNGEGWTTLDGATRFHSMPASLPIGGADGSAGQPLCIGTMKDYTVMLDGGMMAPPFAFLCFADDEKHAIEQATNAYPGLTVQSVYFAGSAFA